MKIFEVTKPQNVVEPEQPEEQQVQQEPQQEPEVSAPAEPERKPRYKWQTGPSQQAYGAPDINLQNPETGKMEYNPAWGEWSQTEKGKEYRAASKAHFDQKNKECTNTSVSPGYFVPKEVNLEEVVIVRIEDKICMLPRWTTGGHPLNGGDDEKCQLRKQGNNGSIGNSSLIASIQNR